MVSPTWVLHAGQSLSESSSANLAFESYLQNSAKGPVSRILSCAVVPLDAASPRTFISDLPGGFGDCMEQPAPRYAREPPDGIGQMPSAAWPLANASLPIWSCSGWGLPCPRHYCRSGALLPHLFTL